MPDFRNSHAHPLLGFVLKFLDPRPTKNGCVSISHKGEFPAYSSLFVRYEEKHDPSPESTIQSIQKPILTLAILALAAPIALVWATGSFDPRPASADIASYYLECPQTSVREGSRVVVYLNRVTNHTHTSLFSANTPLSRIRQHQTTTWNRTATMTGQTMPRGMPIGLGTPSRSDRTTRPSP